MPLKWWRKLNSFFSPLLFRWLPDTLKIRHIDKNVFSTEDLFSSNCGKSVGWETYSSEEMPDDVPKHFKILSKSAGSRRQQARLTANTDSHTSLLSLRWPITLFWQTDHFHNFINNNTNLSKRFGGVTEPITQSHHILLVAVSCPAAGWRKRYYFMTVKLKSAGCFSTTNCVLFLRRLNETHLRTLEFSAGWTSFSSESCKVTWAGLGSSLGRKKKKTHSDE